MRGPSVLYTPLNRDFVQEVASVSLPSVYWHFFAPTSGKVDLETLCKDEQWLRILPMASVLLSLLWEAWTLARDVSRWTSS